MAVRLMMGVFFLLLAGPALIKPLTAAAQEQKPATPPAAAPKPASPDGFGNVQVLTGVHDLLPTMHFIRASLGVRCDYCHITQTGKYYLDDKPAKRRAREMIIMTRNLNETVYGGKPVVTCNTCHNGSVIPVAVPRIATNFVNTTRVEPFEPPAPALPSVANVLAHYEAATRMGTMGPAHLRIEVSRAKIIDAGTPSARVLPRADQAAAEALVDGERGAATTTASNGQVQRVGSDGKRVWIVTANGPQWITAGDLAQLKRKINPLLVLRVRPEDYSSLIVANAEKLDGSDTYKLDAITADGSAETLWFAKSDGVLLRRTYYHQTLLGPEPEQYDLSEYKHIGAQQLPTVINASYLDDQHLGVLKRLLKVTLDTTVKDSDFQPPPSADKRPESK
jgi:hypothetical protein